MLKQILVTGSSRGIGKAVALRLAQSGYDIVLHCNKNISKAEEVQKKIISLGRNARILQFDISNRQECNEVLSSDIEKNGIYYGIVLNAGIAKDNVFPAMEDEEWDCVLNINLGGFYNVLKPLVMQMISERVKGRIITMSSISGLCGNRGQVNYSASKAGIIGATKALSLELAKRGITVNCIAPGVIETDMISEIPTEEVKKMIPMKRFGKPEEVASLVNYLMSDEAAYITGQVISVNGGLYL
ncbi:TPA: 3-oxoacyl-ACP reductase FabG [Candidatus Avigastranaerophilus faecigallinarum]|nr:3-oxoacyl-ACP reductase FabG [Candidatus Avigastranaerophilus faecigallinarum]